MTLDQKLLLLQTLILGATGFVVWLYTRAAQRSNEIQEQPLLSLYFKNTTQPGSSTNGVLRLKNIGKGAAYNIRIERFSVEGCSYRFHLTNPSLEATESSSLKMHIRTPDGGTEGSDMMWFLTRLNPETFRPETLAKVRSNPAIFVINYLGVNGKSHHSAFALYSNLPPVGEIVTQFLTRGRGKLTWDKAKRLWLSSEIIRSPVED